MRLMLVAVCLFVVGCHGPLTKPMVDRLDEQIQQTVDDAWLNMFTPPDRLDPPGCPSASRPSVRKRDDRRHCNRVYDVGLAAVAGVTVTVHQSPESPV